MLLCIPRVCRSAWHLVGAQGVLPASLLIVLANDRTLACIRCSVHCNVLSTSLSAGAYRDVFHSCSVLCGLLPPPFWAESGAHPDQSSHRHGPARGFPQSSEARVGPRGVADSQRIPGSGADQRGGAGARERAFLSGEAQRFPSRISASLEAAKGANPAPRLRQEARTSVPSSGGAGSRAGSGCPPGGGPGGWLQRVRQSPGPAKKEQKEWPPTRAVSPFRGCQDWARDAPAVALSP